MLGRHITTQRILKECRLAIAEYDRICSEFWAEAGADGIQRKTDFQKLLANIENHSYTPMEALLAVYDFFERHQGTSRLVKCIRDSLYCLLDIKLSRNVTNVYRMAANILEAEQELADRMNAIKTEAGYNADVGMMMHSMRSSTTGS